MTGMGKAYLYWNTVKNLKPVQIRCQIENRICRDRKKKYLDRVKGLKGSESQNEMKLLIPELDCSPGYLQRFHVDGLLRNEVELLHESHKIEKEWHAADASHLWNFNLHYLEFLIPLAVKYTDTGEERYFLKWEEFMDSWLKQPSADSFEPYTISMRIPNLLICLELLREKLRNTELKSRVMTSIYQQYRYLLQTQERALLANHYFENLKTIVISSLLFRELDIYHKYFDLFLKEIGEQVLPDGLHFERSLMYHKIILEDILRVHMALNSAHHTGDAEKLIPAIQIMASAMVRLEQGFLRTPLFNDAGNNASKDKGALLRAIERHLSNSVILPFLKLLPNSSNNESYSTGNVSSEKDDSKETVAAAEGFEASGYFKLYHGDTAVLFDCGEIGPSYMGGHAHCDCLSFELSVRGKSLFVNSGTGQYQGELRSFFRSTAAHNTVMIDDREQSELWGEHRAARRMRSVKGKIQGEALMGRFQSYLGDSFLRSLKWNNDKTLAITDAFKSHDAEAHIARQFLHLAPGYRYERKGKQINVMEGQALRAIVKIPAESDYLIHTEGSLTAYAEDFGRYQKKQVLEIRTQFRDKVQLQIEIEIQTGE